MTLDKSEEAVILPSTLETHTDNKDQDLCPVCSAPSLSSCRNCKKISYCGKGHQRSHWKVHKSDCYPLILLEDPFLGCRLIATRTIKKGEVILREKSLVSGPKIRSKSPTETTTTGQEPVACLGCFNIVKSDYLCSTCSWPVCGRECEEGGGHRENECKIFASCKLQPSAPLLEGRKHKYDAVSVLRGLLIKENDPIKWQKIKDLRMKLDEKRELEAKIRVEDLAPFCKTFIQDQCTLPQFTEDDIDNVLRVFTTQAFAASQVRASRQGFHLFHAATFADQNCIPNSSWRIQPNFEIHFRALVQISFGERATISHTDVTEGTAVRQNQLWNMKCLGCTCERCRDPAELGTFFSAIKCPCHSSDGYLIPNSRPLLLLENVGSRTMDWLCTECGHKKNSDFYQEILTSFKTNMSRINILPNTDSFGFILKLEELNRYSGVTLHPNHFEIYKAEMEILQQISKELDGNPWPQVAVDKLANLVKKFITLSQKWLCVADVLWPGCTEQRGVLLNYLQQGLTMSLVIIISMNMKRTEDTLEESVTEKQLQNEFVRILQTRKEVLDIFCLSVDGSRGRRIAESMVLECPEIKILRKRFHYVLTED